MVVQAMTDIKASYTRYQQTPPGSVDWDAAARDNVNALCHGTANFEFLGMDEDRAEEHARQLALSRRRHELRMDAARRRGVQQAEREFDRLEREEYLRDYRERAFQSLEAGELIPDD